MNRVVLASMFLFCASMAQAGEVGAVAAGYRFAGVPNFLLNGTFQDHQPIIVHSGVLEYLLEDQESCWRFGLVVSQFAIPDGYWRVPETRVDQAVFAEFPIGMAGLTAAYGWRIPLTDFLSLTPTVGVGVLYVYGDIYATELIPGCEGGVTSCSHWSSVTRHEVSLTSRWMPTLQVSALLQWEIVDGSLVGVEAGMVNLPFAGVTFQQSLDL